MNPPSEGSNCDITLNLVNSNGRLNLTKVRAGFQTRYLLLIPEAHSLGLLSSEQNKVDLFIENLILAANLILHKTALSTLEGDLPESQVEYKRQEIEEIVEDKPYGRHITITDTVIITEKVEVMMEFAEEIDENRLISLLQQINRVSITKLQNNTPMELVNLKKSFNEYRNAMSVFDRLMIFKHLFNSLEFATNSDGMDRTGPNLDNEVAKITNLQTSDVCEWRQFYDRAKHVDRKGKDLTTFIEGMKNLPNFLVPLRLATQAVIFARINTFGI
jgi:hypothetical protein